LPKEFEYERKMDGDIQFILPAPIRREDFPKETLENKNPSSCRMFYFAETKINQFITFINQFIAPYESLFSFSLRSIKTINTIIY